MSSEKEKPERPKSKMGGLGSMFRTLGRGGKKDKNEKTVTVTGPVHGAVLGVPISSFSDVPPVARRCLDYLETDPILRLEGFTLQTPSLTEVQRLIKIFEDSDPETVSLANESPDTVCGVLRKWLRSLPEPLFMYDAYESWIALQHNPVNEDLFGDIQNLMFQLHPTHYLVLQRIIRFLRKLSMYGAVNKLTASALGFNWQPCLLWSQASATALDAMKVGPDGGLAGSIVTTMIEHYDKLFIEDSNWMPPQFDVPAPSSTPVSAPISIQNGANYDGSSISASNTSISRSEDEELSHSEGTPLVSTPTQTHSVSHPTSQQQPGTMNAAQQTPPQYGQMQASSGSMPTSISGSPSSAPGSFLPLPGAATTSAASTSTLPPLTIPTYGAHPQVSNSMPVTPITPLVAPNNTPPLARSFAAPPTQPTRTTSAPRFDEPSGPASPRLSLPPANSSPQPGRKKQPALVNGYTQATTLCDFTDMSDGLLQFFKNEHIYVTHKHDDGWWEGWKRGRRGFFPAQYVAEICI
jgi:hypothetical protein